MPKHTASTDQTCYACDAVSTHLITAHSVIVAGLIRLAACDKREPFIQDEGVESINPLTVPAATSDKS